MSCFVFTCHIHLSLSLLIYWEGATALQQQERTCSVTVLCTHVSAQGKMGLGVINLSRQDKWKVPTPEPLIYHERVPA